MKYTKIDDEIPFDPTLKAENFTPLKKSFRIWDFGKRRMIYPENQLSEYIVSLDGRIFLSSQYPNMTIDGVVLQFTGLTDKNGRKIYEGDIVVNDTSLQTSRIRHPTNNYSIIHFSEGAISPFSRYDRVIKGEALSYKVLGNIYENIELLDRVNRIIKNGSINIEDSSVSNAIKHIII